MRNKSILLRFWKKKPDLLIFYEKKLLERFGIFDEACTFNPSCTLVISFRIIWCFALGLFEREPIKILYIKAIVRGLKPRYIINFYDNNVTVIAALAGISNLNWLNVQNGNRFDYQTLDFSEFPKFTINDYVVFGLAHKLQIKSSGFDVKRFHFYPSVSCASWKKKGPCISRTDFTKRLCLAGENWSGTDRKFPGIESCVGSLAKHIQKFCLSHGYEFVLASVDLHKEKPGGCSDWNFYNEYIDMSKVVVTTRRHDINNSFKQGINSDLTIAFCSTLLVDLAGLGGKVLYCDYYGFPWDWPFNYPKWILKNHWHDYQLFENRVMSLINMDLAEEGDYWQSVKSLNDISNCTTDKSVIDDLMSFVGQRETE